MITVTSEQVRNYLPHEEMTDFVAPALLSNPAYRSTLPLVRACGYLYCYMLAIEDPDRAVQNADSVALLALGKLDYNSGKLKENCSFISILGLYLDQNDWGSPGNEGFGVPVSPPVSPPASPPVSS